MNRKITRKTLLYKSGVEYSDYTINHVEGCSHGCRYPCYAMLMKQRFGKFKDYNDWLQPRIIVNALELLEKEVPKLKNKIKFVQLCFTTDPFMFKNKEICDLSIKIIKFLNQNGIKCTALTKGVLPKELDQLSKDNEFGITLISLNEEFRKTMEPGSASYLERIESLRYLHNKGFKTWVSIEPYPTPNIINQNILEILDAISFVDKIIFGRLNYNTKVTQYKNYKEFFNTIAEQVINFCLENKIDYHIKNGTLSEVK